MIVCGEVKINNNSVLVSARDCFYDVFVQISSGQFQHKSVFSLCGSSNIVRPVI